MPTWNYEVVQVRGRAGVFDDVKGLMRAVGTLTNIHESTQDTPWKMKDAPADYLADEIQGILGLTVDVGEMVGRFKLSQTESRAILIVWCKA
nr:FMN-binding negative transcriptional regulator [Moraxella lacunata]